MSGKGRFGFGLGLVAAGLLALPFVGCGGKIDNPWPSDKSLHVLVTLPAFYSFATNVAGEDAAVLCLLQTVGPHDYQPTAEDIVKVRDAHVFIINGLDLDTAFANKLKNSSGNTDLPIVKLGDNLDTKLKMDEGEKEEAGHEHEHGEFDPHAWMGLPEAVHMVRDIRDALKKKDPAHAQNYEHRAAEYVKKLEKLLADGKARLALVPKENRKLIAFHDSLRYFARCLDLTMAGTIEPRPGMPPDPEQFRQLVTMCRKEHVRVLAVEPQYPQEAANTVLKEVNREGISGTKIVEVDPLETADPNEGFGPEFYERKMRQNIDRLADALR